MESHSSVPRSKRRGRQLRYIAAELGAAGAFVVALLVATRAFETPAPAFARVAAILALVAVLPIWFALYVAHIRGLDELERSIEYRSLALACGVTIFVTTAWGLGGAFLGLPTLPLVFVAPLAAALYGVVRFAIGAGYK
jgi:hypothetical protein